MLPRLGAGAGAVPYSLQLAQAAEGLVDAKGLARELTEKVAQRCRELVELRSIEVKAGVGEQWRMEENNSKNVEKTPGFQWFSMDFPYK